MSAHDAPVADDRTAGEAEKEGAKGARRRRCFALLAAAAMALLGVSAAVVVAVRVFGPRYRSPIAEAAQRTTPEVAALLYEADEVARELLEKFPDSPDVMNLIGQLHYRFGKSEEAVSWWKRCVAADPGYAAAYDSMGTVALENGDNERAAECFRKAMELDPDSSALPIRLAEVLINQGKLQEAVRVLEANLRKHPRSMGTLALLGHGCVQLKQYKKAKQYLELAIQIGPEYTNAYFGLATACAKLGQPEQSRRYMEKFRALKKRDEQRHRSELKTLDDLAAVATQVAQTHTTAAMVYLGYNQPQPAEEHLKRAVELAADHVPSREVLAWLYHRQGRTDEALAVLDELAQRAADNVDAQVTCGSLYDQMGYFARAEAAYQRAIELTPQLGGPYAALADLYLRNGRKLVEAKALAEKAVQLEPVARYYFLLSVACLHTGRRSEALAAIQQALAAEPDNPQYQKFRNMIEGGQSDARLPAGSP